ncbi:MAG: ornithine carbamoyltransferase [Phycisphaeraceae bacterium]|nr:ornithine carbamoyltransferase [Phycisphaeraceae bacterium]
MPTTRESTRPSVELGCKDLLRITDLAVHEILPLLEDARRLKADYAPWRHAFAQKSIVLLFEKPSLRTRVSFEIGFAKFGGIAVYLDHETRPIGQRESIADYGHNLERWANAIVARTAHHATIEVLAQNARIPVINALSDLHHPCQALADFMTLAEHGFKFKHGRLAWVGDGNNVCHSVIEMAATVGCRLVVITPRGCEPSDEVLRTAEARACRTGAVIEVTNDLDRVAGSDAVYTDIWTSMNQPDSPERTALFEPYRVDEALMARAGGSALFMHCLPAHRGQEVTDAVIDSERSIVFDQAENRMHVQNALLLHQLSKPR